MQLENRHACGNTEGWFAQTLAIGIIWVFVACAGLAQHSQPDEGDVQARMVCDGAQTRAGWHTLPVHAHAVLSGRAVAQNGGSV